MEGVSNLARSLCNIQRKKISIYKQRGYYLDVSFYNILLAAQKTGVNISREKRQLNFDTEYEFDSDGSDNEEVPTPRTRIVHPVPLPDSSFIVEEERQNLASSTGGVKPSIALQAEAMKLAKLRAYEEKKEVALAEKLKKTEEANQLKAELAKQGKLEAQLKKEQAAELKKVAATQKKEAQHAAKAKQVEEKRQLATAKLLERAVKGGSSRGRGRIGA